MQKNILGFLFVLCIALAVLAVSQSRKAAEWKTRSTAVEKTVEANGATLERQKQTIARLQEEKNLLDQELREVMARQSSTSNPVDNAIATLPVQNVSAPSAAEGKGGLLAKMMEDPEMKKMMREQQRQTVSMMYGGLFKDLKLTPEETEKISALMLENQMRSVEKGTAYLNQPEKKVEIERAMVEDKRQFEKQVKEFLGDERYAQYLEFNKTLPDRVALAQMNSQFRENPLTETQSAQILKFMKEERQRAIAAGKATSQSELNATISEEAMNKRLAEQEEINLRVLDRAKTVISSEQLEILGRSFSNGLVMQRTGMNMARSMLRAGKDSTNAVAPPAK